MATAQIGNLVGGGRVHDNAQTSYGTGADGTNSLEPKIFAATQNIAAMKTALNTWDSTTYSTARLNQMSHNDCLHVLRINHAAIAAAI